MHTRILSAVLLLAVVASALAVVLRAPPGERGACSVLVLGVLAATVLPGVVGALAAPSRAAYARHAAVVAQSAALSTLSAVVVAISGAADGRAADRERSPAGDGAVLMHGGADGTPPHGAPPPAQAQAPPPPAETVKITLQLPGVKSVRFDENPPEVLTYEPYPQESNVFSLGNGEGNGTHNGTVRPGAGAGEGAKASDLPSRFPNLPDLPQNNGPSRVEIERDKERRRQAELDRAQAKGRGDGKGGGGGADDTDLRLLSRLVKARAISERLSGGSTRPLRMILTMPLLLAAAAVLPIVAAGSDDREEGSEPFEDGTGEGGGAGRGRGAQGVVLEAALAAAGVAAIGVLLPSGRAGPVALWVSVVVPLWVVSLLVQRRAALRAPA